MIEKPKRPKQPSIQERQPPRTLQELINRYDLDNTKIYDFLDELVKQLNLEVIKQDKSQIIYHGWHGIILTRSDNTWLNLYLYGTDRLKEGTYSIANQFRIVTYGTTNSDLTVPLSAVDSIIRRDWGFEIALLRSKITGIGSGQYNGIAVVAENLNLVSK